MSAYTFDEMRVHIGHKIECVRYGQGDECLNVAVECVDCNEVLFDLNEDECFFKEVEEH